MKSISTVILFVCALLVCGCNSIGNGVPVSGKIQIRLPQSIEIQGDWYAEIICNSSENSVETVIDSNLEDCIGISAYGNLKISLPTKISPMVLPVLKIRLQKNFSELSVEDKSICKVINFSSKNKLEIELSDRAVCVFDNIQAENIEAELSDYAKLSLKGSVKKLSAEVEKRAVLEAENVDTLKLECSDNAVCRIKKCNSAGVYAENAAIVTFKEAKNVNSRIRDDAQINCPVNILENIKK